MDFDLNGDLEENKPFILSCDSRARGDLIDYFWLKDGYKIDPEYLNITFSNSNKSISFKKLDHLKNDGYYTCQLQIKKTKQIIQNDLLFEVKRNYLFV